MSKENPECGDLFLTPGDRFLLVVNNFHKLVNNFHQYFPDESDEFIVVGIDNSSAPFFFLGNQSYGCSITRCKESGVKYLGNISGLADKLLKELKNA